MLSKSKYKRLAVLGIKYCPAVMALSCCLKLLFLDLSTHTHTIWLLFVNLINLLINVLITYWAFCLGRTFGLCWRHRVLCNSAYVGYLILLIFIVFDVSKSITFPIVLSYALIILAMTISFRLNTSCNGK